MSLEVRREAKIRDLSIGKPHVVILGAGASRAAFPNGDGNGQNVPLMSDLSRIEGISKALHRAGVGHIETDFETLYSELRTSRTNRDALDELECEVWRYFSGLSLPDEPSLYDHLLLSLRSKDVVATFNWRV